MDLIRAIGKQLNMKVEIQNMGFDALIPAINAGNIDVAAAGMSITPERQNAVDMSDPYYVSGLVVVVNKDCLLYTSLLFSEKAPDVYAIFIGLLLANVIMACMGYSLIRLFVKVTDVPQTVLLPVSYTHLDYH